MFWLGFAIGVFVGVLAVVLTACVMVNRSDEE